MARILVVDDQPHLTQVMALFLTRKGHEVTRACNGKAALELLRAESFDVLVTDVDMPEMDGLTLVGQDHAIDRLQGVIVLTGRSDYEAIAQVQNKPHVRVGPKPFSPSHLEQMVDDLLSSHAPVAAS